MGSVGEIEAAAAGGADTVFVAVGRDVEEGKATLRWALRHFPGKRIRLLHVQQPTRNTEFAASKPKQCAVYDLHEVEMRKMPEVLNEYLVFLAQAGVVDSDKVWIETDSIEKGILESISRYNIRWLVIGAAADKDNSKLDSRKAVFICQNAPDFSQIWFICKGCLIYTKPECLKSERPTFKQKSLDRLMNPECRIIQRSRSGEVSIKQLGRSFSSLELFDGYFDKSEDDRGPVLRRLRSQCLEQPENKKIQGQPAGGLYCRLEQAIVDGKSSMPQEFEEAVRRWKEEDNALDAKMKALTLSHSVYPAQSVEILYNKEVNERKELEKMLGSKRQQSDRVKNQYHTTRRELLTVREQNSILEKRAQKSKLEVKELEEKFQSAVELLITFKERRDKLRVEHQDALKEVRDLRRSVQVGTPSLCGPQILSFSFAEIVEATHNFDPSQRIGEGKYGTVYKGLLRHLHVAIRMLPSFGSAGAVDFQRRVEVLSRVRHPNLVTLIGTCPESQSLVFEYLKAGSLDKRLSCKGKSKTPPLTWNIRTQIAADICSALVYLHSHKPPIIHGNLKSSKVLLNANFVAKVGDLGIYCLVPKNENSKIAKSDAESDSEVTSLYEDPEFLVSGQLTPESDVYSFGIILLQLVTGKSSLSIVKDVKCALDKGNFDKVVDFSAGDCPLDQAKWLAQLGLRCCERNKLDRPDLVSEISSVIESIRALSIESASSSRSKEPGKTPAHFVCPIYQEVMKDPLIAADGFTYEAEAIHGWLLSGHNTSPMTNLKLEHNDLVPNHALLYAIQEWQELL